LTVDRHDLVAFLHATALGGADGKEAIDGGGRVGNGPLTCLDHIDPRLEGADLLIQGANLGLTTRAAFGVALGEDRRLDVLIAEIKFAPKL
jgi:hypothetical protein